MHLKSYIRDKDYYRRRNIIVHRYDKIMFLSCIKLNENKYELTFLLDYLFCTKENITLIPIKVIIPYDEYLKVIKSKFGVWFKTSQLPTYGFITVYQNTRNNQLIFKSTRNAPYCKRGQSNQYRHELLFKAEVRNKLLLEHVR